MKKKLLLLSLTLAALLFLGSSSTVLAGGVAVIINTSELTLSVGQKYQLVMMVGGYETPAKSWSSSKKSVAKVSSKGLVTARKAGKATISCDTGYGYSLTCKVTVKKKLELSGYLNKPYTKLAKQAPETRRLSAAEDPAGEGNIYVFEDSGGTYLFFRFDTKTKKIESLQIATGMEDPSPQERYTLYGVALNMKKNDANKALKSKGYKLKSKEKSDIRTVYIYKKSGHTIRLSIMGGKVDYFQWLR